jgi:hypothetical protein
MSEIGFRRAAVLGSRRSPHDARFIEQLEFKSCLVTRRLHLHLAAEQWQSCQVEAGAEP